MPGVRRRLRDVTKKVSGVLAGPRDESPEPAADVSDAAPADAAADAAPEAAADAPDDSSPAGTATAPAADAPAPDQEEHPRDRRRPARAARRRAQDPRCAEAVEQARAAATTSPALPSATTSASRSRTSPRPAGTSSRTPSPRPTRSTSAGGGPARSPAPRAATSSPSTRSCCCPGGGALHTPAWVPWSGHVQPGDLGPGDLLPPGEGRPAGLVPAYADVDAERLPFDLHREMGLGRPRVLSRDGRLDAAERWYDGLRGPDAPLAEGGTRRPAARAASSPRWPGRSAGSSVRAPTAWPPTTVASSP